MATWTYEFKLAPREPVERGELTAASEDEARRKLRVLLATRHACRQAPSW